MKKLPYLLFVLAFTFYNCITIKKEKDIAEPIQEIEKTKGIEETPETEINIEPKKEEHMETNLNSFTDLLGKYPTQVNLFKIEKFANRLKQINRLNYDDLIANWNTETPLTIEGQIIHSSGCKAHDCPSSGYELFIDLKNDNINIYHFRSNTLRVYTEKDWITLPNGFSKEIETKKSNAKIGSMDDDMTSTYNITL